MGVDDHQHQQRNQEHDREDDGDAIEVLLDDARTGLRGIHRAGNHVGDARALAGMQQNEHDQTCAGHNQQDQKNDNERTQSTILF